MDALLTQAYLAQRSAASQAVAGALAPKATAKSAATTGTTGTSTSSTAAANDSSTITSSDFLTLLVSELKNQDPTQPTDPNAYITQLAQVNSLEQLIQINSGIQTLDSSVPATATTTTSSSGKTVTATGAPAPAAAASHPVFTPALTTSAASQIHKGLQGVAAQ
jgi:flagellar basal-body rod modification protein FlgD